jgi:CRISPR type I-D-associated protein Csc2
MSAFEKVTPYLVERPRPLIGAETVQLLLLREVLDYTVLRTEETRELNTVQTPLSVTKGEPVRRVAFLATKQKAAESRQLEQMLRTAVATVGMVPLRRDGTVALVPTAERQTREEAVECYLKDNLCLSCPRCGLFGATSTESGQQRRANIKHRIEYSTAFSLLPFEDIATSLTFNAINDRNQTTGQALGERPSVIPATLFPSVVTLKSVTQRELILTVKTLLACKSYGAEPRIGGDVRNHLIGVVAGWEEIITALEFSLELYDRQNDLSCQAIANLLTETYQPLAGYPQHVSVLLAEEVAALVKACSETDVDRAFVEAAYQDIAGYRQEQLR